MNCVSKQALFRVITALMNMQVPGVDVQENAGSTSDLVVLIVVFHVPMVRMHISRACHGFRCHVVTERSCELTLASMLPRPNSWLLSRCYGDSGVQRQ